MSRDILIVLSHPDIRHSRINRHLRRSVASLGRVTLHELYERYPDMHIDVEREQALLREHSLIVLQHPMYWYHAPALTQQWLESVFTDDFAMGRNSQLRGKAMYCVVSTATSRYEFDTLMARDASPEGLLLPFQLTAAFCGMRFLPPLIYYGGAEEDEQVLASHAHLYRRQLESWSANG